MQPPFEILFYSEEELSPYDPPIRKSKSSLFSKRSIEQVMQLVDKASLGSHTIPLSELEPEAKFFLKILDGFGALSVDIIEHHMTISMISKIATNFCHSLLLSLLHRFPVIRDWYHLSGVKKHFYGIDLLLFFERNRIELSRETGFRPEVFLHKNVSFSIIKGRSALRIEDVFLLQMNKDWQRYNFIGGKQEDIDNGDFKRTVLREIQEELNVDMNSVRVTELTKTPIRSYGMTGHNGALCSYDCMLYQAFFSKPIPSHAKNIWVSIDELKSNQGKKGEIFMINPYYRQFILNHLEGGLEELPYSFNNKIEGSSTVWKIISHVSENRTLYIAVLTILAAIIVFIKALLK